MFLLIIVNEKVFWFERDQFTLFIQSLFDEIQIFIHSTTSTSQSFHEDQKMRFEKYSTDLSNEVFGDSYGISNQVDHLEVDFLEK